MPKQAWYHADSLGSVRVLSTGTVLNTSSFTAFGSDAGKTGTTANSHGFAGEQSDPTGLSYNRARYYDPTLGRFIQRDTVVGDPTNPLSMNLFVYTQKQSC